MLAMSKSRDEKKMSGDVAVELRGEASSTSVLVELDSPQREIESYNGSTEDTSVELRGTRPGHLATPRYASNVKGNLQLPKPRRDGQGSYLQQLFVTSTPLMVADLAVLVLATCAANLFGYSWLNPADAGSVASTWLLSVGFALVLLNAGQGLYPGVGFGTVDEIRRLSLSIAIVALVAASSLRTASPLFWDRLYFLVIAFTICIVMAPMVRRLVRRRMAETSWWGFPTLVCGNETTVHSVWQWLMANRRLGLRPVGVITDPNQLEMDDSDSWYLGPWEDARKLAEEHHTYWAVYVESADGHEDAAMVAGTYLGNVPQVFVLSKLTGIPDHWNRHQMDEGLSGLMIEHHLLLPIQQIVKRTMDLVIASIVFLLLLPLFCGLAIAIKLTSRGAVFYGHERIGKDNSRFLAWKFRTMISGADQLIEEYLRKHPEMREEWERDHKLRDDPRVTTLGKFMRKWSIDELPQVWNVLCGEMSVVGPRPIVEDEIVKYGPHFETFCSVLPGITGLWQVCGRNDTTYDERVQLDIYYIHHWSPWMDIYLLFRTVGTVLFSKGAY